MARVTCNICKADNRDAIEAAGEKATNGQMTWAAAAREFGIPDQRSLQNHMEKHYVSEVVSAVATQRETFEGQVLRTYEELIAEAENEPDPHLRALTLQEAHNTLGIPHTRPSQENLLKTRKQKQDEQAQQNSMSALAWFITKMSHSAVAPPVPVEVLTLELPPGGEE
jgi:hypothetical protein